MQTNSNAFKDCKFSREIYADQIINIVKNSTHVHSEFKSTVIALDAPWGTGKTTFVNMLCNKIDEKYDSNITVFKYNAWENDMHDSALEALLYSIMSHDSFTDLNNASGLLKSVSEIIKFGAKSALKYKLGEEFHYIVDHSAEAVSNIMTISTFKDIKERKDIYDKFKKDFKLYFKDKKVLIVIDELDRCKPTFAIQTLEIVKHLFDIEDVTFLLSMDMDQLKHSIATVYGNNMNSSGYLNKFINCKLRLPLPNKMLYINSLFESNDLFNKNNSNEFLRALKDIRLLFTYSKLSVRDINIIFNEFLLFYKGNNLNDSAEESQIAILYLYFIILKYLNQEDVTSNPSAHAIDFFEMHNELSLSSKLVACASINKPMFEILRASNSNSYFDIKEIKHSFNSLSNAGYRINKSEVTPLIQIIFNEAQLYLKSEVRSIKLHEYVNMKLNMLPNMVDINN